MAALATELGFHMSEADLAAYHEALLPSIEAYNAVDQMAQDVSAFLAWAAEPESDSRKNMGFATLIFLLIGTILAYMAYQNVWAGRKH